MLASGEFRNGGWRFWKWLLDSKVMVRLLIYLKKIISSPEEKKKEEKNGRKYKKVGSDLWFDKLHNQWPHPFHY